MRERAGIEASFGWIFSLIIGAAVLVLAIIAVRGFVTQEREVQQTFSAQEVANWLATTKSGQEASSVPRNLTFHAVTRLSVSCFSGGEALGAQELRVRTRSGIGEPWQDSGAPARFTQSYVFMQEQAEGKQFHVLVKPIHLPYAIGDAVIVLSEKYCFVSPSGEVEDDLALLQSSSGQGTIASVASIEQCARNSTSVCFVGQEGGVSTRCQIVVDVRTKSITTREKQRVNYEDRLALAAIVSSPELYRCQVERMMRRSAELAQLYRKKSELVAVQTGGCSAAVQQELAAYEALTRNASASHLGTVWQQARQLAAANPAACPLWAGEMT